MGRRREVVLIWLLLLTSSCSSGTHQLIVEVRTDLAPGIEFVAVQAQLNGGAPITIRASAGEDFATGIRLAEYTELVGERYTLDVDALDAMGETVLARQARVEVREDLAIVIVLSRSCLSVACPGADDAPGATTCVAGRCTVPECTEANPSACAAPTCTGDTECSSSTACVAASCLEGGCFEAPDDASCGAGEACVPDRGCVTAMSPPDGGVDAAPDAAPDTGAGRDAAGCPELPCTPFPQCGCAVDETCTAGPTNNCISTGSVALFGTCDGNSDCQPGMICPLIGPGMRTVCAPYCRATADCPGMGSLCIEGRGEPGLGACAPACDPLTLTGCPASRTCIAQPADVLPTGTPAAVTTCSDLDGSELGQGQGCAGPDLCAPGLLCVDAGMGGQRCYGLCFDDGECTMGSSCNRTVDIDVNGTIYGLCL